MRSRTVRTRPAAALALLTAAAAVLGAGAPSGAAPGTTRTAQQAQQALQEQKDGCKPVPVPPSATDGPSVKAIKSKGVLVIGVDQNSYHWGARNPNTGNLEGFDIDLAKRIGRDVMGDEKKVVLKPVATADRIPALTSTDGSGVDLIVRTMTINCDNLDKVAFSQPYFNIKQRVLVPHSSKAANVDDAITGKTVCAASGSVAWKVLDAKRTAKRIVQVDNQLDCLVRMQLGQVDATMTDDELAAGQSAQDQTVRLVDGFEQPETIGVAMRQDRTDLTARVNQVISDFYRDRGWENSFEKWVQPYLPDGSKDPSLYWPVN
ncbi:transporter substrate-binding domain-containing protein [Kitasatospora sp. SUK 42]|uniref:transporter substrate-binding domain-containing protein n=1 Tax=Kitasatospora sp. SUK 42 TaxID=1588882 RepID=UPI0018C9605F|nr:transporter substrate-binding domain-containing protein [Kitasatospora sp. SUK 42]MBV2151561.1 transporter substrate-binding domain-containing protein [Kitasatospora sp. SUK 42]